MMSSMTVLVVPLVEVVDQLRALVTEVPGVLEAQTADASVRRYPRHLGDAKMPTCRANASSSTSTRCARGRTRRRSGSAEVRDRRSTSTSTGGSSRWRRSTGPRASAIRGSGRWPTGGRRCASPPACAATDMDACDRWYEACGTALHVDGRRFYDVDVAHELLESIGATAGRVGRRARRPDHARRRPRRPRARRRHVRRVRRADHRLRRRPCGVRTGRRAGTDRATMRWRCGI